MNIEFGLTLPQHRCNGCSIELFFQAVVLQFSISRSHIAEYRNLTSSAVFIEIACLVKKHDAYILRGTVHRLGGTAEGRHNGKMKEEKEERKEMIVTVLRRNLLTRHCNKSQYWPRGAPKHGKTAENEKA